MDGRRALVVITFPTQLRQLDHYDKEDVALVLRQISKGVEAGSHTSTGTIVVPYQRRSAMRVSIDLRSASRKMWELEMKYHGLPAEYVAEIAAVAQSYSHYINNLAGQAGNEGTSYSVSFSYNAEGTELDGISGALKEVYAPSKPARAERLLYSQAIEVQDAGIALLTQLQQGAHREIKSGQRK